MIKAEGVPIPDRLLRRSLWPLWQGARTIAVMSTHSSRLALAALLVCVSVPVRLTGQRVTPLPRLGVSENKHFLVTTAGRPFFWLGDTAWELFHRLTREEAGRYLRNRAERRFTVIQAVALAELDGLNAPNAYGFRPLLNNDPLTPDVKDGPNNDYWDHVDFIVNQAGALGLYIGLLPTWGDKWNIGSGAGPEIFTTKNSEAYGEWIGRRYRDTPNIIWILGGDRGFTTEAQKEVIRAMARGLRAGDGGAHLITLHPNGANGSAATFHDEGWLDFNMRQNGHGTEFTGRYDQTRADYDRMPAKPVLDGEPVYEDHPVAFNAAKFGHTVASDVRRPLYWDLFGGAFGHTYGHHSVWQMFAPGRKPINNPLMPWSEAVDQPGAAQMQFARTLLESRPFLTRIPDDDVLVSSSVPTAMPGAGRYRFAATRDRNGSYAMVYAPVGRPFTVRLNKISGSKVRAWWFNPRTGRATSIGMFDNAGERTFMPPDPGEMLDWVLVLDDASKQFVAPGRAAR